MPAPYYDHAGRILDGRYELVERIGAGGFATVYRARDRNVHGRIVAVKVLHPERAGDPGTVQRFVREVKLAVRLTGKHRDRLVQILDQGYCEAEAPRLLYFAMEFVEGPTLQRLLSESTGGVFPWRRAVAIGHEVAQALVALHQHGVVHRDIKPGNCILEEDRVRLLDLGIATLLPDHESSGVVRITHPNMIVGTLRYMSPEQQSGRACDARVDLYALGVMLYEFLTGNAPVFREDRDHPAANRPLVLVPPSQVAPGQGIPPAVDAVVLQALGPRINERFQSASALVAALAATMSSESTDEWARRPRQLPRRERWLFGAAHVLGVWTLCAGTVVAATTLAVGASLAHRESSTGEPASLERDESPPVKQPAEPTGAAGGEVVVAAAVVQPAEVAAAAPTETSTADAPAADDAAPPPGGTDDSGAAPAEVPGGSAAPPSGAGAHAPGDGPADREQPAKPSRVERSALAARFSAQRRRAVAACGPLCGLPSARGLKARVRVQVRADGAVQARAQEPWQSTPLGDCLEGFARSLEFEATEQGGGFTWVVKF
ncbi:MAG: serine/threonine protein kinase [Myxococcales bacterium]|nr:serine/threonine protein kinase [Myxococcales bacterium]